MKSRVRFHWRSSIPIDARLRPAGPFEIHGWALVDGDGNPVVTGPFDDKEVLVIAEGFVATHAAVGHIRVDFEKAQGVPKRRRWWRRG